MNQCRAEKQVTKDRKRSQDYARSHREKMRELSSEYYRSNHARMILQHKEYRDPHRVEVRERQARYRSGHREAIRKSNRDSTRQRVVQTRIELFRVYGNSCQCCGEANERFLTLEHVDGGVTHERERRGPVAIMRDAIRANDPARFKILCFNCHMGMHSNGGICPHKAESIKGSSANTDSHMVVGAVR